MNLTLLRVLIWKMSKIFSLENRGAVCAQKSEFVTARTARLQWLQKPSLRTFFWISQWEQEHDLLPILDANTRNCTRSTVLFSLNPLTPVPPVTTHAKNFSISLCRLQPPEKMHVETIDFPTLPEDSLVLLLFYCSWGQINQSEWTFWA